MVINTQNHFFNILNVAVILKRLKNCETAYGDIYPHLQTPPSKLISSPFNFFHTKLTYLAETR